MESPGMDPELLHRYEKLVRDPPDRLVCAISHELFQSPVVAADGYTYERREIEEWFVKHNTSPQTNLELEHKMLVPNLEKRSDVQEYMDKIVAKGLKLAGELRDARFYREASVLLKLAKSYAPRKKKMEILVELADVLKMLDDSSSLEQSREVRNELACELAEDENYSQAIFVYFDLLEDNVELEHLQQFIHLHKVANFPVDIGRLCRIFCRQGDVSEIQLLELVEAKLGRETAFRMQVEFFVSSLAEELDGPLSPKTENGETKDSNLLLMLRDRAHSLLGMHSRHISTPSEELSNELREMVTHTDAMQRIFNTMVDPVHRQVSDDIRSSIWDDPLNEDCVRFVDDEGIERIRGATLNELIRYLTEPAKDKHLKRDQFPVPQQMFLMTYRRFATAATILVKLIDRYHVPIPQPFEKFVQPQPQIPEGERKGKAKVANEDSGDDGESVEGKRDESTRYDVSVDDAASMTSDWAQELDGEMFSIEFRDWKENVQKPIQLRVINVLIDWVLLYFEDFRDNPPLFHSLFHFIRSTLGVEKDQRFKLLARHLDHVIQHKLRELTREGDFLFGNGRRNVASSGGSKRFVLNVGPPTPKLPVSRSLYSRDLTLMEIDDEELARQLTLVEFDLFTMVRPSDLLAMSWNKPFGVLRAPNIRRVIDRSNRFGSMIAYMIIRVEKVKQRARVMLKFLRVAQALRRMNNFHSLMMINSALNNQSIVRLQHTRELMGKEGLEIQAEIDELVGPGNFCGYREAVRTAQLPCLPYLDVFLTDLLTCQESVPDMLDGDNPRLIHWQKNEQLFHIVRRVQEYQLVPFNFHPIAQIQHLLHGNRFVGEMDLLRLSRVREPPKASRQEIL